MKGGKERKKMVKAKTITEEKSKEKKVPMDPLLIATMKVKIVGITPLLLNRLSDKEKQSMLDKQMGKGSEKNKIRDPKQEVEDKIHKLSGDKVGIPIVSLKKSMVEAAPYLDVDKKLIRGSLFILPEENNLIPISYKKMVVNEAITRDSGINRTPRTTFRPEFRDWSCEFTVKYNAKQITPEQILGLLKLSGFHIGVGSWRPQCDGTYGQFTPA
jgi:hypothetical protein